ESSPGAWWSAALLDPSSVSEVRISGRWDCCHERLDGWEVRVGDDANPWNNPRCGARQAALEAGGRRTVSCSVEDSDHAQGVMHGSYVGVVLPGTEPLSLCEVEAFGPRRW
ncbi:unnamed protein product, partial [Polarella glacialis]